MLTLKELKVITKMPTENEVSLKLLANFYEKYISNRIYEIELENGKILTFKIENKYFSHLIGLHKFTDKSRRNKNKLLRYNKELKSQKGFENVKCSRITLKDLQEIGGRTKAYKNYRKRILNFPFTYQLLRRSKFLSYNKEIVESETKIKGDYIFVNNINEDKLHFFFIDTLEEENDSLVPITFIVTKRSDFNYVSSQEILKIREITIKSLDNNRILERYSHNEMIDNVVRR
ncbi:hypothetical protein [uncultured Clostridium sp.]|uniref:hypothetical protein n=1 Tax=uncultured Clostridium sp. TaxID=59620 RepID=UPI00262B8E27|nr:hypothetical protein [uncultured Clostridium sp.]